MLLPSLQLIDITCYKLGKRFDRFPRGVGGAKDVAGRGHDVPELGPFYGVRNVRSAGLDLEIARFLVSSESGQGASLNQSWSWRPWHCQRSLVMKSSIETNMKY